MFANKWSQNTTFQFSVKLFSNKMHEATSADPKPLPSTKHQYKDLIDTPAGKGLTSWLSFVVSSVSLSLSHWYPGSGVVLDCIDS